jgi:ferritin-like metal-binding protein YciE
MNGIAHQSREQAAAIDEVNTAVRTMDEMTQHNAALVEEMNASIEQTEAQAVQLDGIVDIFAIQQRSPVTARAANEAAPPARSIGAGARGLQARLTTAAKSYLTRGNAAVDTEWSEF